MNTEQRNNLLYEALETELGGVENHKTAISCAVNEDLKKEWEEYLEHTTRHVEIVEALFENLDLDTQAQTPRRKIVKHIGDSLVMV